MRERRANGWYPTAFRVIALIVVPYVSGCAGLATNVAANALSGTGTVFASDDDPELIAQAAPFGLKTMEAVLAQTPKHQGLLLSLASGYTQYGYAFLEESADVIAEEDYEAAEALKARAKKHYTRARQYGLRGLEARHDNFEHRLRNDPNELHEALRTKDVPFLYWTAAAWALSITASNLDPEAIADFPLVEAMTRWALELDEDWDDGALHTLMVSLEASRPGGSLDVAEKHFERALSLDGGRRVGTYVSMAENVCVSRQDLGRFRELIEAALNVDISKYPEDRLANVIMNRRAARLRAREEDLFLEGFEDSGSQTSLR